MIITANLSFKPSGSEEVTVVENDIDPINAAFHAFSIAKDPTSPDGTYILSLKSDTHEGDEVRISFPSEARLQVDENVIADMGIYDNLAIPYYFRVQRGILLMAATRLHDAITRVEASS